MTQGNAVTYNRARGVANKQAILDLLAVGSVTHKSAATRLGVDISTARAHLLDLVESGTVQRERAVRSGRVTGQPAWVYSLAPQAISYEVVIEPTDEATDFDSFWVVDLPVPLDNDRVLLQTDDGQFFVATPVAVIG